MPREIPVHLRKRVAARARFRCEYCLYPEDRSGFAHQVDHILSRKHGGLSTFDNLAYCCLFCNRYKGSDIAAIHEETGQVVELFHPRHDRWSRHFQFSGAYIEALTPKGDVTMRLLRFNRAERIVERGILQRAGRYPFDPGSP